MHDDVGAHERGAVEGAGRRVPLELLRIGRGAPNQPAHGVALRGEVGGQRPAEPARRACDDEGSSRYWMHRNLPVAVATTMLTESLRAVARRVTGCSESAGKLMPKSR